MGLAKDFRDFAIRGNMMDLAVGMIIGAAFTSLLLRVARIAPRSSKKRKPTAWQRLRLKTLKAKGELVTDEGK